MGLESYFVQLIPEGVYPIQKDGINCFNGHSKLEITEFLEWIDRVEKVTSQKYLQFLYDEAIKINIGEELGYVKEITLEGCFAWYPDGLSLCFQFIRTIETFFEIQVYHPGGLNFKVTSEDDFIEKVSNIYLKKYEEFVKRFGCLSLKVLPGDYFYDTYTKQRKKNFWLRLLNSK